VQVLKNHIHNGKQLVNSVAFNYNLIVKYCDKDQ
jgi:hypothetical protein